MCYKVSTAPKELIYEIMKQSGYAFFDYIHHYQADGFDRPFLNITTNAEPGIVQPAQWKLLPAQVRNEAEAAGYANTLNAACETIFEKSSYAPYVHQRCLVWVNGFYESNHPRPRVSVPYFIHMPDKRPFSMGGLWTDWVNRDTGEVKKTLAIITTPANQLLSAIHNEKKRMPLIVHRNARRQWLHGSLDNMRSLMHPYHDGELQAYQVSSFINRRDIDRNVPEAQLERT